MRARLAVLCAVALALSASLAAAAPEACVQTGAQRLPLRPIDKARGLDADHVPALLVGLARFDVRVLGNRDLLLDVRAAVAFERLAAAARAEGHELIAVSGYRSYEEQRFTFFKWTQWELERAAEEGEPIDAETAEARANRYSAYPGHSEHQLGTALDVSTREIDLELSPALAQTAAGRWLADNAHRYGFVTPYPDGKEALTGFRAEPWHLRFVGSRIAGDLLHLHYLDRANDVTVNGYLAALPAPGCAARRGQRSRMLFD